ncbi:hypothetical protein DICA1_F38556 [Diutina catenulata]
MVRTYMAHLGSTRVFASLRMAPLRFQGASSWHTRYIGLVPVRTFATRGEGDASSSAVGGSSSRKDSLSANSSPPGGSSSQPINPSQTPSQDPSQKQPSHTQAPHTTPPTNPSPSFLAHKPASSASRMASGPLSIAPSFMGPQTPLATSQGSQTLATRLRSLLVRDRARVSAGETISAVLSGVVMGNLLWIILGTTTFGLATMYGLYYFDKLFHDDDDDASPTVLGQLASSIISSGLGVKVELGRRLPHLEDGRLRFSDFRIVSNDVVDGKPAFSARVEHMDVSLSFTKWYEGNGLIYDMEIYGMNGELVRRGPREQTPLIDRSYVFESIKVHDSVCMVSNEAQAGPPLRIAVFSGDFQKVSGNRLLVDFFDAQNVSGAINNSMFTIHKRQRALGTGDRTIRFKLDGINLGAVARADPESKFNWMVNGRAEIQADITFPDTPDDHDDYSGVVSTFLAQLQAVTNPKPVESADSAARPPTLLKGALAAIYHTFSKPEPDTETSPYLMVDVTVKFHDLKASMPRSLPSTADDTPFLSLQSLRALIACVNGEAAPNPVVVKTRAIQKMSELYEVSDVSKTPMWDAVVGDIYQELLQLVKQKEQRIMSQRSSMWSHSLASQLVLLGLGVMV